MSANDLFTDIVFFPRKFYVYGLYYSCRIKIEVYMIKIKPVVMPKVKKSIQKRPIKTNEAPNYDFSCEEKGFFMVDGKPVRIIFPR